jgi:hypothetical protein
MSKHVKLGFRYSKWTLTDTDKYARLCCGGCEMTDTLMDPTDPRYLAAVRTAYDADAHRRAARAAREAASAIAAAAAASARLRR